MEKPKHIHNNGQDSVSYEDHLASVDVILGVTIQQILFERDLAKDKAIHAIVNLASAEKAKAKERGRV